TSTSGLRSASCAPRRPIPDAAFTADQDRRIRIGDIRNERPDGAHLRASIEERTVARRLHDRNNAIRATVPVKGPDLRTIPRVSIGRGTSRHGRQDRPTQLPVSGQNFSPLAIEGGGWFCWQLRQKASTGGSPLRLSSSGEDPHHAARKSHPAT